MLAAALGPGSAVASAAPVVTLAAPADGSSGSDATPTYAGTAGAATGDSDTVTVRVYTGALASGLPVQTLTATRSDTAWSVDGSPALDAGTYTAQAEQTDGAGDTGVSAAATFTVEAAALSYSAEVMADAPAAYWRLGEAGGTAAASATGSNAGVYQGGVTLGSTGALESDADTAASLNGTSGTVRVNSSAGLNATGALTIEAWIKPGALPSAGASIARKGSQYQARANSNGSLLFRLWKAGASTDLTSPAGLVGINVWHHVAFAWDGTTMAIYVDGNLKASRAFSGPLDSSTSGLYLGSSSGGYDWLNGVLDEVALYGAGLGQSRVRAHYLAASVADIVAPSLTLSLPADGAVTSETRPSFSGTAGTELGDGSTITVQIHRDTNPTGPPVQVLSTTRSGSAWTVRPGTSLDDGTYIARAEQSDDAGNVGGSAAHAFRVDTAPPSVTLISPADGATTTDPTPALTGTAGAAAGDAATVTVRLYEGTSPAGTPVGTVTGTRQGTAWSAETVSPLPAGTYTARAEQVDSAGNLARSAANTFAVQESPYRDEVMDDSPVAYWRLGELGGALAASETGANAGAYQGGVTLGEFGALAGETDRAVRLDGSNATVRASSSASLNPDFGLTLEAWVKPATLPASSASLIRKGSQYQLRLNANGSLLLRLWTDGVSTDLTTAASLVRPDAWHLVAATWDGATMSLYVNGVLKSSRSLAGPIDAGSSSLYLGSSSGGYDWLTGTLDDAAIYDEALTAERLRAHYLAASTADSRSPQIVLENPSDGASVNDATPTFSGAAGAEPGDSDTVTVLVYSGTNATGTPLQTLTTTRTGQSWTMEPSSALEDGTYTLQAEQSDDAGNTGRSAAHTFRVDTVAPVVTLRSPANGSSTGNHIPTLDGTAGTILDDSSQISVSVYAGSTATGMPVETITTSRWADEWSTRPSAPLVTGTYTAQAEQRDEGGNVGVSAAHTFTILGSPYRDEVMADAPVAYWRLGETAGTTAASETGTNAGIYQGGFTLGGEGAVQPDTNTAVMLSGTNGTVRANSTATLNPTTSLSLEAWVKPAAMPTTSASLVRKGSQYQLRLNPNGSILFRLWKGGVSTDLLSSANSVRVNGWYHVVAVWDGTTMALHLNGNLNSSRAFTGPIDAGSSGYYLGSSSGGYDWFDGTIDEAAVYGSALPESRIHAHYDVIDARAPLVSLQTPTADSVMDARPNFGGVAGTARGDAGSVTVNVYEGAGTEGTPVRTLTGVIRPSGTYSVRVATDLPTGTYTADVSQADGSGNLGRSEPVTFAVDAEADPVILAAGDIASCSSTGDERTAALLDSLPGTVQTLGDNAYEEGSPSQFANCYDPNWGRHKARTRPAVGDHEYLTAGAAGYFDYFGTAAGNPTRGYYAYDLGEWHIVVTNAACGDVPGGCEAGSAQDRFVRANLAANPRVCTLAIISGPRFSSGAIHGSDVGYERLWENFYNAGADLVLSADEHVYERFAPQDPYGEADPARGLREIIVGTGGRSLYAFGLPEPNSEVRMNDAYGVLKLALHPTSYSWSFIPEAGRSSTDAGTGACH